MDRIAPAAPTTPTAPTAPPRRRGPWIAGAIGAVVLGAGVTGWAWHARADPVYDDEIELAHYLDAVKEHRTGAGRLPPPTPGAILAATPDIALPTSTKANKADRSFAATVLVTKSHLAIGGDPLPIADFPDGLQAGAATGLPERYKRAGLNDLFLPDLGNGLAWWNGVARARAVAVGGDYPSGRLAVLADGSTPYRVLLEVVYTAGQTEIGEYALAARTPDGSLGWIALTLPSISAARGVRRDVARPQLELSASITAQGISLKTSGGALAPGCQDVGGGVTIPKVGEQHDYGALTACARRLKNAAPAFKEESEVTLSATPATDYQTLIGVIDALRSDGEEELFPDVHLGIASDKDRPFADMPRTRPYLSTPGGLAALVPGDRKGKGKAPFGSASIGGAAVSGGSVSNASAVVAGMAAGFRRCFNKGLQEDPSMKGSVRITAKIGPNGEVVSVSPSGSGVSAGVVSCVAARVSAAQFAPPEGGNATIVIPVTFVGQ